MLSIKTALMVYFMGSVISMLVALMINIIYKIIKRSDQSATKSA